MMWHGRIDILYVESFFNRPFHPCHSNSELILNQFPNVSHTPVSEMVNIINGTHAVFQLQKILYNLNHVFFNERPLSKRNLHTKLSIEFEPTDFSEVIESPVKEKSSEMALRIT